MISKVKTKYLLLTVIFLSGLFLRVYRYDRLFLFAHDQDLYSWIAKDIIVNKHIRTVGQVTSVDGVFIGPAYYYLIAFFYKISAMNPMSAVVPVTMIGLVTILSFYWLGKKYFSQNIGLILAALYAMSWGAAIFDRWSVPTEPTVLWSVWFLYVILGALDGEVALMPLYGFLVGLVYHIHIALLPILPIPLLAYFMGKGNLKNKLGKIKLKNIFISLIIFLLLSSPFWVFEFKHNFSQVMSMVAAMKTVYVGPTGMRKVTKIIDASGKEWQMRWLYGFDGIGPGYFWLINLAVVFAIIVKKKLSKDRLILFGLWIGLIMLAQFTSRRIISEYYFTNITPILFLLVAIFLDEFVKRKEILVMMMLVFGLINYFWMKKNGDNTESYYERARLVDYVKTDAISKKFPCVAINYISDFGKGVGFRYLFWYKGLNIIKPSTEIPVYNIVIPLQIAEKELDAKFGRFGLILPKNNTVPSQTVCNSKNNQLDPLLGYTE